jgi:hypothetical protein
MKKHFFFFIIIAITLYIFISKHLVQRCINYFLKTTLLLKIRNLNIIIILQINSVLYFRITILNIKNRYYMEEKLFFNTSE